MAIARATYISENFGSDPHTTANITLSGSDRLLMLFCSHNSDFTFASGSPDINGVAFNEMTYSPQEPNYGMGRTFYLWESELPANGAYGIDLDMATGNAGAIIAVLYTGVDESAGFISANSGQSNSPSTYAISSTPTEDDAAVIGFAGRRNQDAHTSTGDLTEVVQQDAGAFVGQSVLAEEILTGAASARDHDGSWTGSKQSWWNVQSIHPAAAGTVDDLLADDVESDSELSTPDVGQEHGLLANDVESASELSTPTLAEIGEDTLLADDIESASELSTPDVGQEHGLLANDVESASELSTPTLAEIGTQNLLAEDIESASELSTPTINRTARRAGGMQLTRRPKARQRPPRIVQPAARPPDSVSKEAARLAVEHAQHRAREAARIADTRARAAAARSSRVRDLRQRGRSVIVSAVADLLRGMKR